MNHRTATGMEARECVGAVWGISASYRSTFILESPIYNIIATSLT